MHVFGNYVGCACEKGKWRWDWLILKSLGFRAQPIHLVLLFWLFLLCDSVTPGSNQLIVVTAFVILTYLYCSCKWYCVMEIGWCVSLRSERHRFFTDLELQLLLKQGQVEVDTHGFVRDYRNCVLIHRRVIEELNQQIKVIDSDVVQYSSPCWLAAALWNKILKHTTASCLGFTHPRFPSMSRICAMLFCVPARPALGRQISRISRCSQNDINNNDNNSINRRDRSNWIQNINHWWC